MAGRDRPGFTTADYMVLVLVLVMSTMIGAFFAYKGRKGTCNKEFLVGNRKLQVFPVTLSMMATFLSAIAFLGMPAENFTYGFQYVLCAIGAVIGVFVATEFFMPIFYDMDAVSVNAYLEHRFRSTLIRKVASMLSIIHQCIYLGVVLYGPSLTLGSVTGLPVWLSIIINGLVCTVYTSLGGIKAVVWTDVLQMTLMIVGFMMVFLPGVFDYGGLRNLFDQAGQHGLLDFDFRLDFQKPFTVWSVLLGWTILWAINYSCSQSMVQRYCAVRTIGRSRATLYVNMIGVAAVLTIACICGLVLFSEYKSCDPVKAGQLAKYDELMPHFVLQRYVDYPGLAGLFVSAAYSGSLSSMSSGYNALSALVIEDFLAGFLSKRLTGDATIRLTKAIATLFGIITMGVAFLASYLRSIVQASVATGGSFVGTLGGLFFLGVLFPWCGSRAALTSMMLALVCSLWISIGSILIPRPLVQSQFTTVKECFSNYNITLSVPIATVAKPSPSIYTISYLWIPVISFSLTFLLGVLFTLVQGLKHSTVVDPHLISPALRGVYRNWLKKLEAERSLNSKITTIYKTTLAQTNSTNGTLRNSLPLEHARAPATATAVAEDAIGRASTLVCAIGVRQPHATGAVAPLQASQSLHNINTMSSLHTLDSTTLTRSLHSASSSSSSNEGRAAAIAGAAASSSRSASKASTAFHSLPYPRQAANRAAPADDTGTPNVNANGIGSGIASLVARDDALVSARADPAVITYV